MIVPGYADKAERHEKRTRKFGNLGAMEKKEEKPKTLSSRIRSNIVKGIAVLFPIYLTYIMMRFLIDLFSKPLTPVLRWATTHLDLQLHPKVADVLIIFSSFVITLFLIGIIGAVAKRVIGAKIMRLFEWILERVPVIRTIYKTFRELVNIMTGETAQSYKKVVYIELPGNAGKVFGFVTGNFRLGDGINYYMVFVPTTPNITTGFLLLLRPDQVFETDLSPDEGLRLVISAGILSKDK